MQIQDDSSIDWPPQDTHSFRAVLHPVDVHTIQSICHLQRHTSVYTPVDKVAQVLEQFVVVARLQVRPLEVRVLGEEREGGGQQRHTAIHHRYHPVLA